MERKPRILVVDDDEPILVLMKNILREFQFEAIVSSSGTKALELARQESPDLILLDMNMPEMSGEEFIERLRRDDDVAHVPVLILSGEPLSREELSRMRAEGAIQKPFDLSQLINQIRQHLGQPAPQTARK